MPLFGAPFFFDFAACYQAAKNRTDFKHLKYLGLMKKYLLLFTFTFVTTLLLLMSSCAGGSITKRQHRKENHQELVIKNRLKNVVEGGSVEKWKENELTNPKNKKIPRAELSVRFKTSKSVVTGCSTH